MIFGENDNMIFNKFRSYKFVASIKAFEPLILVFILTFLFITKSFSLWYI